MTELAISFSRADDTGNPYWLNIELKNDELEDGMSVGKAAKFIDSLYEISQCIDPYNLDGNNPIQENEEPPSIDAFRDLLAQYSFPTCEMNRYGDGGYDATIKVFRSHPSTEIYKLRLSNGTATPARRKEGMVRHVLEIEDAESVVLDNPIIRSPAIAWLGYDGPDIHIYGNRLHWDGKITATIVAEFWTEWDEIDIHVTGEPSVSEIIDGTLPPGYNGEGWYSGDEDGNNLDDVQNVECSVIAFYHYQFSEFVLNRPEPEENVDAEVLNEICAFSFGGSGSVEVPDDDDGVVDPQCYKNCMSRCRETETYEECHPVCYNECLDVCYREEEHISICECSKDETTSIKTYEVKCPEDIATGSHIEDSRPQVKYTDCGERDQVNDPAFYEETCCRPWPWRFGANARPMPKCVKVYSSYSGIGKMDDDEKQRYIDQYKNISFVGVTTESGSCGEQVLEQRVTQKNCCEDAPPVYIPQEDNPSVIGTNDSAVIIATGGTLPFTWQVSGEGVYFLVNGKKTAYATTEGRSVWLHSDDACGTIRITLTDACNESTTYDLRGGLGSWTTVYYTAWNYYWGTGSTNRSCNPDIPEDLLYDPDDPPTEREVVSSSESGWTVRSIIGSIRLTEIGVVGDRVRTTGSSGSCGAGGECGGGRDPEENTWPSCLEVPPGVEFLNCDEGWDCALYYDGERCCFECDPDYRVRYDRYGSVTCGLRTVKIGAQITSRRWEAWTC